MFTKLLAMVIATTLWTDALLTWAADPLSDNTRSTNVNNLQGESRIQYQRAQLLQLRNVTNNSLQCDIPDEIKRKPRK